jgi:hypothetical protein
VLLLALSVVHLSSMRGLKGQRHFGESVTKFNLQDNSPAAHICRENGAEAGLHERKVQ